MGLWAALLALSVVGHPEPPKCEIKGDLSGLVDSVSTVGAALRDSLLSDPRQRRYEPWNAPWHTQQELSALQATIPAWKAKIHPAVLNRIQYLFRAGYLSIEGRQYAQRYATTSFWIDRCARMRLVVTFSVPFDLVAARVAEAGGEVLSVKVPERDRVALWVPPEQLKALAELREVVSISQGGPKCMTPQWNSP